MYKISYFLNSIVNDFMLTILLIFSDFQKKLKFIQKQRRNTKKIISKIIFFFDFKDFIFTKYICKIYILAGKNKIVVNQDLYRNKNDFFNLKIKSF